MISKGRSNPASGAHPDLAGGRLTVDLGALCHNWRLCRDHALRDNPNGETGAVVKANAYGCGIEAVVAALWDAGCRTFFVALRRRRVARQSDRAGSDVLRSQRRIRIRRAAYDRRWFESQFSAACGRLRLWASCRDTPHPCALQIDSGMTRLGMTPDELRLVVDRPAFRRTRRAPVHDPFRLCRRYRPRPRQMRSKPYSSKPVPCLPASHAPPPIPPRRCKPAVTPTISPVPASLLYGGEALNDVANPARPVVTLEARIISVRNAKAGDTVGYGATRNADAATAALPMCRSVMPMATTVPRRTPELPCGSSPNRRMAAFEEHAYPRRRTYLDGHVRLRRDRCGCASG